MLFSTSAPDEQTPGETITLMDEFSSSISMQDDRRLFKLSNTFLGHFSLRTGVWVMACFDLLFGTLMAMCYFHQREIPLVAAGGTRIFCGVWCIIALLTDTEVMMTIYLLMLLFNNCLVLSVCISFLILLTSDSMIICKLPPQPLRPGQRLSRCPLIYRQGFWEGIVTTAEFIVYLYFAYVMICFLNRPQQSEESLQEQPFGKEGSAQEVFPE